MPNPNNVEPIVSELINKVNRSKTVKPMFDGLRENDADGHTTVHMPESEISLLRKEIAELKSLMTPSIILTGQRAIDEYWNLTKPS